MEPNQHIAFRAESFVVDELASRDWQILARNYRRVGTELDIIALKGLTMIVVEVKYRTDHRSCEWNELISQRKKKALQRGALAFITEFPLAWDTVRFDLAIVSGYPEAWQIRYFVGWL